MSRWSAAKRTGRATGSGSAPRESKCGSCGAAWSKTSGLTLANDGWEYCASCWESYYGEPPPPKPGAASIDATRADAPAAGRKGRANPATQEASGPGPGPQAAQEGRDPVGTPGTEAHAAAARPQETDADAPPGAGAPADPQPDLPLAHSELLSLASLRPAAVVRFAAELAELRRQEGGEGVDEARAQQAEELETLRAIFDDGIKVLSAEGESPLLLRVELPVEADSDGPIDVFLSMPEGEVPVGSVEALPPAVLTCALPKLYPLAEAGPPAVALEAVHLGGGSLAELEDMLRSLAAERVGEQLIFEWTSVLQERLAQPRRLVLSEDNSMEIALQLLANDGQARDQRRQREMQTCLVCFDELVGSRGVFLGCGHFGCRDCLERMAQIHVAESDVGALRCPATDCREGFEPEVLRDLLSSDPAALTKWEEASLRRCLEKMGDVVYCPRCDADGDGQRMPCVEDEDHMARCDACGFVFCGRCKGVYHPGADCPTADDRIDALEAKAAGHGPEAAAAREELMTLRHLARTTKRCPNCDMGIEKSEGCSKVICEACKTCFCWRCGKEIKGYDHFASSECRLFDDEEIRRWNQRVKRFDKAQVRAHEARFVAQFLDPEQFREQVYSCPRCKSMVLREGKNNHLRCFQCQTHFCARCWEILPKSNPGDHFQRQKKCPQHGD